MDSIITEEFGNIDEKGILHIYNREGFAEQTKKNPNTKIKLLMIKRDAPISHPLRKYYFGVVLREMQKAFFYAGHEYSKDEIDQIFRKKALYKEVFSEEKGRFVREPHSLKDTDTEVTIPMMVFFIEYCIRFVAINLDWSISFPNEELKREDLTDSQIKHLTQNQ